MAEEEKGPVKIDIKKPRAVGKNTEEIRNVFVRPSQFKKKLQKPRHSALKKYSQKYELPGGKPLKYKFFKHEENLLPYKFFEKSERSKRHCKRLSIKICNKYKIISVDLKKRLFVEEPPDDVQALTDIDNTFFNYVDGRPLPHQKYLFKTLKFVYMNYIRFRHQTGMLNDATLNIDLHYRKENTLYNTSLQNCIQQAKYFDKFMFEDYTKSIDYLNRGEKLKNLLICKVTEFENLAYREFRLMSKIIELGYKYKIQQKYGRFLYYLSPPTWRLNNRAFAQSVEIEAKGFDFGACEDEDTFAIIFEKLRSECRQGLVKPALYFNHPNNLINVFTGIEKRQSHHFTYVTHFTPYTKMLKSTMKTLKENLSHNACTLDNAVKVFEYNLTSDDQRCQELEAKFFRLLNGYYYDNTGTLDVLKFNLHLEFCYEKVYGEKINNMDIFSTAKALEDFYMTFMNKLDAIHNDAVKRAVSLYVEMEKKKWWKANQATRELRSFYRLEQELIRAFASSGSGAAKAIPQTPSTLRSKHLSRCSLHRSRSRVSSRREITEAEHEYLLLFTDWMENEDPLNYLQSLCLEEGDNSHIKKD